MRGKETAPEAEPPPLLPSKPAPVISVRELSLDTTFLDESFARHLPAEVEEGVEIGNRA